MAFSIGLFIAGYDAVI